MGYETKKANRGMLLRRAQAGLLVARCEYNIMSDSRYDQGQGEWMPVNLLDENFRGHKEGFVNLSAWDFKTKSGAAFAKDNGDITLIIHSHSCYTLRIVDKQVKPRIRRYANVVVA